MRSPVTWVQHLDENYVIDPAWISRVGGVVNKLNAAALEAMRSSGGE